MLKQLRLGFSPPNNNNIVCQPQPLRYGMVGTLHLEALLKVVGSSVVMTALEFSAYVWIVL